jgi:hypothetical protein
MRAMRILCVRVCIVFAHVRMVADVYVYCMYACVLCMGVHFSIVHVCACAYRMCCVRIVCERVSLVCVRVRIVCARVCIVRAHVHIVYARVRIVYMRVCVYCMRAYAY